MLNIKEDVHLSKLTTLDIGGVAKQFVQVSTQEELIEAIKYTQENNLTYLVIGRGSNLLVSDEGLDKLVIQNKTSGIVQQVNTLIVKSGTILQDLVDFAIKSNLGGINKLTGIPGTVGGAIFGNAGAYGHGISDHLIEVISFNGQEIITLSKDACQFNYRDSIFKKNGYIILEAKFILEQANSKSLQKEANNVLKQRQIKYPPGIKCPGSFFKNLVAADLPPEILKNIPPDTIVYGKVPAGTLLETVGAKGDKLGNIEIASYHANLFINKGQGKAADFYTLAKKYVQKVKEKFGITLEPEVQLINLPPLN